MNRILVIFVTALPFAIANAHTPDTLQLGKIDSAAGSYVCDSLDFHLEDSAIVHKDTIAVELIDELEPTLQADSSESNQFDGTDNSPVPTSDIEPFDGGVGLEFSPIRGFVGSTWHLKIKILYDDDHYILSLILPDPGNYSEVYPGEDCYLKLENGEIISLPLSKDYKVWNYKVENQYYGYNISSPRIYFTQMLYDIPNSSIEKLLTSNIVKIRYFSRRMPMDVDITEVGNVRKFNKEFRESAQVAKNSFDSKAVAADDQLEGF